MITKLWRWLQKPEESVVSEEKLLKMSPEDVIKYSAAARGNPLLRLIFDEIERANVQAWENSSARDFEAREQIYLTVKAVQRVQHVLFKAINEAEQVAKRQAQAEENAQNGISVD